MSERVFIIKGILGTVSVFTARERNSGSAIEDDIDTWPSARLNMTLRVDDMIATGSGSEVRLEAPNGGMIKLGEHTVLELSILNSIKTQLRDDYDETPAAGPGIRG